MKTAPSWLGRCLAALLAAAALSFAGPQARADEPSALAGPLRALGSEASTDVVAAIVALGALEDARALAALEALYDDRLKVMADGGVLVEEPRTRRLLDPLTGVAREGASAPVRTGETNNEIRRALLPVLAKLRLGAPDRAVRLAAAEDLARRGDEGDAPLLGRALARESDEGVKGALALGLARLELRSRDPETKLRALAALKETPRASLKGDLEPLLRQRADGTWEEPDGRVRAAARTAMNAIETRETLVNGFGHILYGLSLASVFLFAALGLAITFGVMGVINMAHGEMLTVGAYATFVVQSVCARHFPALSPYYVLVAIPVAFLAAALVGIVLERGVIRFLYGRPLETLLATWGISLALIQTFRLVFGASNVAVANPKWLEGGYELAQGLVLPYNRIAVVLFVVMAAVFVWYLLRKTRLGLQVRAVTQNRSMAACMGVRTSRVDMWTFGLGSGIAGLGGVALSQLGNVGPELGQTYILDSFMVVVLGGVGRIAGTVVAALGLGVLQKAFEPLSGAVLGKIAVLALIILFIQRRPQGIFALKGRVEA